MVFSNPTRARLGETKEMRMNSRTREFRARAVAMVLLVACLAATLGTWVSASDSEDVSRNSRSSRSTTKTSASKPNPGDERAELVHLDEKLDRILANEEQILKKFDEIMEELRIIKVRASIRGGT